MLLTLDLQNYPRYNIVGEGNRCLSLLGYFCSDIINPDFFFI